MKNIILSALCLITLVSIPVSVFSAQRELNDLERIIKSGVLRVGMEDNNAFPLYFLNNEGKMCGLDVDIANDIAKQLGVKVKYIRTVKTYDDLEGLLLNNEADVVISWYSINLDRCERIKFTTPYYIDHYAFLVNTVQVPSLLVSNNGNIANVLMDNKKKIGIEGGTGFSHMVEKGFLPGTIIIYGPDDYSKMVNDLIKGEIAAMCGSELELLAIKGINPTQDLLLKIYPIKYVQKIAIGVNSKNDQLLFWLNQYLKEMNYNYTAKEVYDSAMKVYDEGAALKNIEQSGQNIK